MTVITASILIRPAERVPSEASLAEQDPNGWRGGSRVIHLYILPDTARQVSEQTSSRLSPIFRPAFMVFFKAADKKEHL